MFKKSELNKKYQILTDKNVRLPNGKECQVSDIEDEQIIVGMINRKSNLVVLKTEKTKESVGAPSEVVVKP